MSPAERSAGVPLPHAEHGFLGQGMAELASEHGDVPAVVGIVRDQVAEKSRNIGAKALDAAITLQGAADDYAEGVAAGFQRAQGLRWSHRGAIELLGNVFCLRRLQPHHAHIVHVGDDGCNGAALAVRRLRRPGCRRKIVDQILVDAVVGVEGIEQRDRQLARVRFLGSACVRRRILQHG